MSVIYISWFFLSFLQEALLTLPTQVSGLLGATLLQFEATLPGEEKMMKKKLKKKKWREKWKKKKEEK